MIKRLKQALVALLIAAGITAGGALAPISPEPALANGACSSGQLCLYGCYLSESCSAWFRSSVSPGCYPTGANGLEHLTYSVKNLTSKTMRVYHYANCSGASAPLYANTSGNLAYPWIGGNTADHTGIVAFRVP